MDVLVRHAPTPPTLRALAMEGAAVLVAAAATRNNSALDEARDMLKGELTVTIREELVPVVTRHLNASPAAFIHKRHSENSMACDRITQVCS